MALSSTITCANCGEQKQVMHPASGFPPKTCRQCREAQEQAKRDDHLNKLEALPIEERLRLIEAWIYDYKAPVSMRDVMFG